MKKCPFCAEQIQDEAVKCRYCGSDLNAAPKPPWYFSMRTLAWAFFIFPLLWTVLIIVDRRRSKVFKITALVIGIAFTVLYYYIYSEFQQTLSQFTREFNPYNLP